MAARNPFSASEADFRNSRIAFPSPLARSGRRLLPKRRRITKRMMINWDPRKFVIKPKFENKFSINIEYLINRIFN